jgi:hypothetical protein
MKAQAAPEGDMGPQEVEAVAREEAMTIERSQPGDGGDVETGDSGESEREMEGAEPVDQRPVSAKAVRPPSPATDNQAGGKGKAKTGASSGNRTGDQRAAARLPEKSTGAAASANQNQAHGEGAAPSQLAAGSVDVSGPIKRTAVSTDREGRGGAGAKKARAPKAR